MLESIATMKVEEAISLAKYNTWRVGGAARRLLRPQSLADLEAFVASEGLEEPVFWLGLGSNVLIRDGGFAGTVVMTQFGLRTIENLSEDCVRAEAGVTCSKLARELARAGFKDSHFFAGIPGTIGGALAMNAGAFGGETWEYVVAVETLDSQGLRHLRRPDEFTVGYRSVKGPANEWFVAGHFCFPERQQPDAAQAHIRTLLRERACSQPIGVPSCGSVFQNPPGDFAARLIESCGLKGKQHGGAWISGKHANFIVHQGGASAADIEQLLLETQRIVADKTGIVLQPEVRIVGEFL